MNSNESAGKFSSTTMVDLMNNPSEYLAAVRREKARRAERDLTEYIRQAWPIIEPGRKYISNWHIDCISEYLEAVERHQINRLIINIPPRHMKSIAVSVMYPTWSWLTHPEKRFIKISYADALSRKHNIMSRDIISSQWYQRNWGSRFQLKSDANRQSEFRNDKQGLMFSTSTSGTLTGEGGDVIILDDPQDPLMANSDVERAASVSFFTNILQSRLNDARTGTIIVVMQRLHEQDITGHILANSLSYTHLCLPAIAERRIAVRFPMSGRTVVRERGDILNPQRFDKTALDDIKKSMGAVQFASQYQQSPTSAAETAKVLSGGRRGAGR